MKKKTKIKTNNLFSLKLVKLKTVSFIAKPRKPKMKNLIFGYDRPKPARKVTGKLGMSWPQAKARFPKMSPFGDVDKDGVNNWLDCRPFDKNFQAFGKFKSKKKKNGYTEPEQLTAAQRFGPRNLKKLKRIGSGRDRIVYALDKDKVLKIARNVGGLKQNVSESDLDYILDHVKHYETGKDFVVMERVKKLGPKLRKKLRDIQKGPIDKSIDKKTNIIRTIEKLEPDLLNYEIAKGDVFKASSWGEKNGKRVLVDAGVLNEESSKDEHRITKIGEKLARAKRQRIETITSIKQTDNKFAKSNLPKMNRDIERMEIDINEWREVQTQRKAAKVKEKVQDLSEKTKPVKIKLDLNNEVDEPFEIISPVKIKTLYHGTSQERAEKILKEGVRAWKTPQSTKTKRGKVYLTDSPNVAKEWGDYIERNETQKDSSEGTVVKVEIDESKLERDETFEEDWSPSKDFDFKSYSTEGSISPDTIEKFKEEPEEPEEPEEKDKE